MFQGITGAESNKTVKFFPMRIGNAMILQGIDCDGKTIYGYPYRDGNVCKAQTIYAACAPWNDSEPRNCFGCGTIDIPCAYQVELSGFSGICVFSDEDCEWDLSGLNGTYTLINAKNNCGGYANSDPGGPTEGACGLTIPASTTAAPSATDVYLTMTRYATYWYMHADLIHWHCEDIGFSNIIVFNGNVSGSAEDLCDSDWVRGKQFPYLYGPSCKSGSAAVGTITVL
jgi:hypothetical protein